MSIILANNNVAPKNCSKISKYNLHILFMKIPMKWAKTRK